METSLCCAEVSREAASSLRRKALVGQRSHHEMKSDGGNNVGDPHHPDIIAVPQLPHHPDIIALFLFVC